jgi:hypothetical protein
MPLQLATAPQNRTRLEAVLNGAALTLGAVQAAAITSTSASGVTTLQAATQDAVRILGRAGGTASRTLTITTAALGADRTVTFPDAAGTVALLSEANVFTGALTVPNGTAAAPGIRLTGEAHGLYRVNATSLGFSVAGTAAASLTSAGAFAATSLTASGLTSGRVPFVTTGGLLTDSANLFFASAGAGIVTIGNGASAGPSLFLDGGGGTAGNIFFRVGGVTRWINEVSGAESGSDTGSAFRIRARNDAGSAIDDPITIVRASGGAITLARPVTCTSTLQATEYRVSGTKVLGAQGAAVADATGGSVIDVEARAAINALLARMRNHGSIAT